MPVRTQASSANAYVACDEKSGNVQLYHGIRYA